ncbi:MAG: DNA ligase [Myxococcales bacterium]
MPDLEDGQSVEVQGSGSAMYTLKNVGGVYSCSCPAWRNQSAGIERRTCKHLKAYRGEELELSRVGGAAPSPRRPEASGTTGTPTAPKAAGGEPPVLLAERWEGDIQPEGWWMSEKLDGVRAYWNGKNFITRQGNTYLAPDWFVEGLPDTPLDGELWVDRKAFSRTISIVRRQDKSDHWKAVKYLVFDAPSIKDPFERRVQACQDLLQTRAPKFAAWHPHELCKGVDHLKAELARINGLGGEGLMLRKPNSLYQVGRSSTLLKVKTFHDAEATVLEHVAGLGRHKGRMGSLLVQLPDGTRFNVGTGFSDHEREAPPTVGSVITFRYFELTEAGVPRFPSYVGLRAEAAIAAPVAPQEPARKNVPRPVAPPAPAAAPTPAAAPAPSGSGAKRHFEFVEGASSKFWEVEIKGNDQYVTYGRIGSAGQTKLKTFSTPEAAAADTAKLIAEKTKKGYAET